MIIYHIFEEYLIAAICLLLAGKALVRGKEPVVAESPEFRSRNFLFGGGFAILGISGLIHASIHAVPFDNNLLYQTLLGYCLGLLCIILAISVERPRSKTFFPFLYIPLLFLLSPGIYESFPIFEEFRPLIWISVAYLSGVVFIQYFAIYYRTRARLVLLASFGFLLYCVSSIFLFFPADIGAPMWLYGHIFRPLAFIVLLFGIPRSPMTRSGGGSILYRALTAFSLLAAVPLLIFGTVMFYENINPVGLEGRRLLVFVLMLATFASALVFGLGMSIRLIGPLLRLKGDVDKFTDHSLGRRIEVTSRDEIGELTTAFNDMLDRLDKAVLERERFSRLAATGELAATLAHEIKNPLNAIGGAVNYIKKNYEGELIQEFLKVISEEVSRINTLTGTLLDFAKPVKSNPRPNDIGELIQDTMRLLDLEFQDMNITTQIAVAEEMPMISFDCHQIKQLLINLVINAIQATGRDGTVGITASRRDGALALTVSDNGSGISEDDQKKIFNPFYTTKTRGTGLGLAISKRIATEHGGDLAVESTVGVGTKFTLTLPSGVRNG